MKKIIFLLCGMLSLMTSCYQVDVPESQNEPDLCQVNADAIHSLDQVYKIADACLGKETTRNSSENYRVDFLLRSPKSRSVESESDILAYILNSTDGNGWIIVANDNRINPILAFNYEGSFDVNVSNEHPVREMFLDQIENYIDELDPEGLEVNPHFPMVGYNTIGPKVYFSWNQTEPYNYYVLNNLGFTYTGCVATAASTLMTYCADNLTYHGTTFNFKAMRYTFSGPNPNAAIQPIYTMAEAKDLAALLVYYVGPDINTLYTDSASTAYSSTALNFMRGLGFTIPQSYLYSYNDQDVLSYLRDDYLIYIAGRRLGNELKGHAWVIDGAKYDITYHTSWDDYTISNLTVHCRWGWGGSYDGYFSGDVFELPSRSYHNLTYFAVKQNITNYINTRPIP